MRSIRQFLLDRWQMIATVLIFLAFLWAYLYVPSALARRYGSPDETAQAVAISLVSHTFSARKTEILATTFPWLHPRSWVSMGNAIVPVGFLGEVALFFIPFWLIPQEYWSIVASLLILSAMFPLFRLLRTRFGVLPAWIGVITCFAFPSWLYYGNRSLFPNLLQVALFLWSLYLMESPAFENRTKSLLFGFVAGLSFAIRPFELLWLLPWSCWWIWKKEMRSSWSWILIGVVIGCLPAFLIGWMTYGSAFSFGYWIAGNPMPADVSIPIIASTSVSAWTKFFPYGIHPHAIWQNLFQFTEVFFWPWILAAFVGLVGLRQRWRGKIDWTIIGLIVWTGFVLILVYGSGIYQDNINPTAVTVGNSFLRYLVPLGLIVGVVFAFFASQLRSRSEKFVFSMGILFLVFIGFWMAFIRDDEGLIPMRKELLRYDTIAQASKQWFGANSVILSPRSDKIFFPNMQVVSPMPSREEVVRLLRSERGGVGYFDRTLTDVQRSEWEKLGVHAELLQTFGNESLYTFTLMP